jgi:hypothetical protein
MAERKLGYMELIDFIAGGSTPEQVVAFRPSAETQKHVSELLEKNRKGELNESETSELDMYTELEHVFRMAKIRAREIIAERS